MSRTTTSFPARVMAWLMQGGSPDPFLLATILGLVLFGAVMVYSASGVAALEKFGTRYYFALKHVVWLLLGLGAMVVAMRFDYRRLKQPRVVFLLLGVTGALLLATFAFPRLNGAHRWILVRGFSFQPSELAKLVAIIYLSFMLERRLAADMVTSFWRTFLPSSLLVGLLAGLVLIEPDLGTALLVGLSLPVLHFAAGVPMRYHALAGLAVAPFAYYQLFHIGFRMDRLKAFLNPFDYALNEGFQTVQSLIAVGSGGLSGLGFAASRQKLLFLPEAHNDFIFAIIAEELGLSGALTLVIVFGVLMWRGLRVALYAPDNFGRLLAIGITMMITTQALFNISVTLNLVPAKGLPLPFVSYGGSALLFALLSAGLLLNVSCAAEAESARLTEPGRREFGEVTY